MAEQKPNEDKDFKPEVVTEEDIVNNEPQYTDARYDAPVSRVIPAEQAGPYEVKRWPTMDVEPDPDNPEPTNALGYPEDYFEERRLKAQQALELKKQAEAEAQAKAAAAQAQREAEEQAAKEPHVTAEELEEIRKAAADEGHSEGFEKGHEEGLKQGLEEGTAEGLAKGHDEGFAKGHDEGFAKGRDEGYAKGRAQGLADGEAIVLEQSERFRHLADALANPLRECDREVTEQLSSMVALLARAVIGREIKGDSDFLVKSVEKAVALLPAAEHGCAVSLCPDDAALVEAAVGREYLKAQKWDLRVSENLKPGDVMVSTEQSEVNWRLEDRIASVLEEFKESAAAASEGALHEDIPGAPAWDAPPEKPLDVPQTLEEAAPAAAEPAPEEASQGQDQPENQPEPQAQQEQQPEAAPPEGAAEVQA